MMLSESLTGANLETRRWKLLIRITQFFQIHLSPFNQLKLFDICFHQVFEEIIEL